MYWVLMALELQSDVLVKAMSVSKKKKSRIDELTSGEYQ